MCFKYEEEYEVCFDSLVIGSQEESLAILLHEEYNVEITDKKEFTHSLFEFFEEMHLKGVIRPVKEKT